MQIEHELKLNFNDVLIKPKRSQINSRQEVNLIRKFVTKNSNKEIEGFPIVAANMDTTGTIEIAKVLSQYQAFTCLHKYYKIESIINFFSNDPSSEFAFYTTGITKDDFYRLKLLHNKVKLPRICIDVANGYTESFQNNVKAIRDMFPGSILMAGNVATPEMVSELLISGGVDIVKIGIGPGSVCDTRIVTGVGYPQLSAIIECADAAHSLGGLVCADGGCKTSGDVAKAFAANADFVMLGGMFAGCEECEGDWEYEDGEKVSLTFYGMSSENAMHKYNGGMAEYRTSEGDCVIVNNKGSASTVIRQIMGGLRSTCTYVGALQLKDLSKCTTFIKCGSIK